MSDRGGRCGSFVYFVLRGRGNLEQGGIKKQVIQGIVLVACWSIWKSRNEAIFSGKRCSSDKVFGDIQASSFMWYKSRTRCRDMDWDRWRNFCLG
ncbi:hypothetical protein Hdeb2414_s0016g00487221 [Helianthus debilis subsp. tardiflorus]